MIDWERVAQLRAEIGPEDFTEVVELFLEEVEEVIRRLAEAPNQATLREDLHFLKGSAVNLGFERFGMMCHDGERRAAQGAAADVAVGEILACFDVSKRIFLETAAPRAVA